MTAVPRVAIITNVLPVYRKAFYERLLQRDDLQVTIYSQEQLAGSNLKLCHDHFPDNVRLVTVTGLPREKIAWQHLPLKQLLKDHDHFIFYGNPRVVSSVIWSCVFRFLGKKVALWGQAHTAGANPKSENLRLYWWKLFNNLFVYSDVEVESLRRRGFLTPNLIGMNNGLDQEEIERVKQTWSGERLEQWQKENAIYNKVVILSCARLEPKNQFCHMVEALPELVKSQPDLVWCVIGSGQEEAAIMERALELDVANHIIWLGAIYEEAELAPWFLSARIMVHPAAIGLSLLHAFGYGLPVVTHDNAEHHMPEFAAMSHGKTGYLYPEGNTGYLVKAVIEALSDNEALSLMGNQALAVVEKSYNVKTMVDRFSSLVKAMV